MMMRRVFLLLVIGCGGSRGAAESGPDTAGAHTASGSSSDSCAVTLRVAQLAMSHDTCWVDEKVTGASGTLTFPCSGGTAEARFSSIVFTGQMSDGQVELLLATQFKYSDGCRWESRQRLAGVLESGALLYEYSEAPAAGQQGCVYGCTAAAKVELLR